MGVLSSTVKFFSTVSLRMHGWMAYVLIGIRWMGSWHEIFRPSWHHSSVTQKRVNAWEGCTIVTYTTKYIAIYCNILRYIAIIESCCFLVFSGVGVVVVVVFETTAIRWCSKLDQYKSYKYNKICYKFVFV